MPKSIAMQKETSSKRRPSPRRSPFHPLCKKSPPAHLLRRSSQHRVLSTSKHAIERLLLHSRVINQRRLQHIILRPKTSLIVGREPPTPGLALLRHDKVVLRPWRQLSCCALDTLDLGRDQQDAWVVA